MTLTTATATPAVRKLNATSWKVQSKSHPEASHTVRRHWDGQLLCSCPATRKCWHIKEIEAMSSPAPEPTFIPVQDASDFDEDPFAEFDFEVPIPERRAPAPARSIGHKPTFIELEDLFRK